MHTSRQAERIHIEHRVVRVQELRHGAELLAIVAGLGHLLLLAELVVSSRRRRKWLEGRWIGPRPRDFGSILVIDHISLRLVLLFCTHGINLGRT